MRRWLAVVLFGFWHTREGGGQASQSRDNACSTCPPPSRLDHDPFNVTRISFAPMLENRDQKLRF